MTKNEDDRTRGLNLRDIPGLAAMLREERWIDWWRQPVKRKDGKPGFRKVPRIPGTLENARSNDLTGARGYDVARAAALADKGLAGVGWMMLDDLGRVAIDIDHCRDPVTGKVDGWALALLTAAPGAYREVTPSGTGLRIIGRFTPAEGPLEAFQGNLQVKPWVEGLGADGETERRWWGVGIKARAAVEIFHACARFITVTGWDGTGDCEADISAVVEWLMERTERGRTRAGAAAPPPAMLLGEIEDVVACLAEIPNPDNPDWDRFAVRIGMAVWGATGGSEEGFAAWVEWSAKAESQHDESVCIERWDHWSASTPPGSGIWTLIRRARETAGAGWLPPTWRPERVFEVVEGPEGSGGIPPWAPFGGEVADGAAKGEAARGRLAELAARVTYVQALHRWLDRETWILLDEPRLKQTAQRMGIECAMFQGGKGIAARLGLEGSGMRWVAGVTMRPGRGETVTEAWGVCANTWRPSALKPRAGATAGDAGVWLEHARRLIPDAADRERVLDRLAWALQNPGRKINSALVLIGGQGTGKDSFLSPFWAAIGEHNHSVVRGTKLGGQFNGYMETAWLLISEMPPAHKRDVYEDLKGDLTTPPDVIRINRKGVEEYDIPNVLNVAVTTNHAGAIALAEDDRRFDVVGTVMAVEGTEAEIGIYYTALHRWYSHDGGREIVAGYLMGRDVAAFNPNARPVATVAKNTMAREGAHPAVGWTTHLWDEEQPLHTRDYVVVREILTKGQRGEWDAGTGVSRGITWAHVVSALRLMGWVQLERQIVDGDRRARVWARAAVAELASQVSAAALRECLEKDRVKTAGMGFERVKL